MSREEFDLGDGNYLEILMRDNIAEDQRVTSYGRMIWYQENPLNTRKIVMFRLIESTVVIETVAVRDGKLSVIAGDEESFRGTSFPLESFTYPEIFMTLDSLGAFYG